MLSRRMPERPYWKSGHFCFTVVARRGLMPLGMLDPASDMNLASVRLSQEGMELAADGRAALRVVDASLESRRP